MPVAINIWHIFDNSRQIKYIFTLLYMNIYPICSYISCCSYICLVMQKQSPRGVLLEKGVLQTSCKFARAYLCVGVTSVNLQSGFGEIAHLHCAFAKHPSWRAPRGTCFWTKIILYALFNLFFLINYTSGKFKVSLLLH